MPTIRFNVTSMYIKTTEWVFYKCLRYTLANYMDEEILEVAETVLECDFSLQPLHI